MYISNLRHKVRHILMVYVGSTIKRARRGKERGRAYVGIDGVIDAVAGEVIRLTAVGLVGFCLACVEAGGEPAAEFGIVSEHLVSVAVRSLQTKNDAMK
jgi:hypothetical protein